MKHFYVQKSIRRIFYIKICVHYPNNAWPVAVPFLWRRMGCNRWAAVSNCKPPKCNLEGVPDRVTSARVKWLHLINRRHSVQPESVMHNEKWHRDAWQLTPALISVLLLSDHGSTKSVTPHSKWRRKKLVGLQKNSPARPSGVAWIMHEAEFEWRRNLCGLSTRPYFIILVEPDTGVNTKRITEEHTHSLASRDLVRAPVL